MSGFRIALADAVNLAAKAAIIAVGILAACR